MSKQRSAPSSESARCCFVRARRSRRSRSKSTRCSQSTAIVPKVFSATPMPFPPGPSPLRRPAPASAPSGPREPARSGIGTSMPPVAARVRRDARKPPLRRPRRARPRRRSSVALVDHDRPPGLSSTDATSVSAVERHERAGIDDLGADALPVPAAPPPRVRRTPCELVATIVRSSPSRFTSATPNGIVYSSSGTGALRREHHLVLEEDDRVVVADRGLEQALGVVRRRRERDLEPGDVRRPRRGGSGCAGRPSGEWRREWCGCVSGAFSLPPDM